MTAVHYADPDHGVSLSEALREAAAIAPVARVIVSTFELYHPLGTPDGAIYLVNDLQNFTGTKEATATRDASTAVEFLAIYVVDTRPDESASAGSPQLSLTAGNVSGLISDALRAARGSVEPWEIIERLYATDQPSAPAQMPPVELLVSAMQIDESIATLTASFGDPANVAVPTLTLKRSEYPGLVR